MNELSNEDIKNKFKTFDEDKKSLIISSVNESSVPLTNYSPFVKIDDDYFICVSSSLPHFTNMMNQNQIHVLIIQDEENASNIYARQRLYFNATSQLIDNSDEIFDLFDLKYEDELSFLRQMKDFKVIKISPKEKSLVLGFGAAYKMDINGQLKQKNITHK